ncbi:MAG: HAMP domain-containing histidine kinase [Candidatus Cloacimonetes bacterium]|nr:HAMP domain-containing histidine kinase [Candidatus Cloacimonadota bacterium]
MKKGRIKHSLFSMSRYLAFFIAVCLVVTSSFLLYFRTVMNVAGVEFQRSEIEYAAKLTFVNILFLSLVLTIIYAVVRTVRIRKPLNRILDALSHLSRGDFSISIDEGVPGNETEFDVIAKDLNKVAIELRNVETLRTDFVSNVSHEIKSPLAVIQNYATLLSSPDLEPQQRIEYCGQIINGTQRLSTLVSDILNLNRLENQEIFPSQKSYDLGEQLCECLLSFENVWEDKKIEINTDLQSDVCIISDRNLLDIVWKNLFSNAFKFTPSGGNVSLSLHVEDDAAVVHVCDSGCGITPEVGKHMFDKFYQGDTSRKSESNGLGLALVRRIVDILNVDISVKSKAGEGTDFRLVLPIEIQQKQ